MRLFVAIDLDAAARQAIADEQKRLMRAFGRTDRSLRWIQPDQMHLTLVFIGNVEDPRAAKIVDTMSADITVPPFTIAFAGTGVFPPHGAPSVLWLGVSRGTPEAVELQRTVADRLEKVGVARERRPYHPHLTLARWRTSRPSDRQQVVEAGRDGDVARVEVGAVVLYRSHLSPAGPTYAVLTSASLRT